MARKEFKEGEAVIFTDEGIEISGTVIDNLSTQYFVVLEDDREVFVFKSDSRLVKA